MQANNEASDTPKVRESRRPLDGVRVVDLTRFVAGPECGSLLVALGADVVKVEPPEGDPLRRMSPGGFVAYNSGKRSVTIDLASEGGRDQLHRLAANADVLMCNSRPGAMEAYGLGSADLVSLYPALIAVSLVGFPEAMAEDRSRRATDTILQAETGMMQLTGEDGGGPLKVGFVAVDVAAGYLMCNIILAALLLRTDTGRGGQHELSLFETAMHMQAMPMADFARTGVDPVRAGNAAPLGAPSGSFGTATDPIVLVAYLDEHFRALCEEMAFEHFLADPLFGSMQSRLENRGVLEAALGERFRTAPAAEWVGRLQARGVMAAEIRSYSDALHIARQAGVCVAAGVDGWRTAVYPSVPRALTWVELGLDSSGRSEDAEGVIGDWCLAQPRAGVSE